MEQYSRRFIEELAKHINPAILEFFNKKKNLMNFPADNVAELIDDTLMEYLEGSRKNVSFALYCPRTDRAVVLCDLFYCI